MDQSVASRTRNVQNQRVWVINLNLLQRFEVEYEKGDSANYGILPLCRPCHG